MAKCSGRLGGLQHRGARRALAQKEAQRVLGGHDPRDSARQLESGAEDQKEWQGRAQAAGPERPEPRAAPQLRAGGRAGRAARDVRPFR